MAMPGCPMKDRIEKLEKKVKELCAKVDKLHHGMAAKKGKDYDKPAMKKKMQDKMEKMREKKEMMEKKKGEAKKCSACGTMHSKDKKCPAKEKMDKKKMMEKKAEMKEKMEEKKEAMQEKMKKMMGMMSRAAKLRHKVLMEARLNPADPQTVLALKDELGLNEGQVKRLKKLTDRVRKRTASILSEGQKEKLKKLKGTPESMKGMHEKMMEKMKKK